MSRIIDLVIADGKAVESIAWLAARAMDDRMVNDKHYGIKVSGCGMDKGFHLVYNLGRTLFPDGVPCCGAKCRSNDHSNGDRDYRVSPEHVHHDGGYAFNSKWL